MGRNYDWVPSEKLLVKAKLAWKLHKDGMRREDAAKQIGLSQGSFSRSLKHLGLSESINKPTKAKRRKKRETPTLSTISVDTPETLSVNTDRSGSDPLVVVALVRQSQVGSFLKSL